MLSRTANNLYWVARYMERMDYVARLLEVGQRMAGLSRGGEEWRSMLIAAGCESAFVKKHETVTTAAVVDFLLPRPGQLLQHPVLHHHRAAKRPRGPHGDHHGHVGGAQRHLAAEPGALRRSTSDRRT